MSGSVHTNGVENFWSCLKRGLGGTYISVRPYQLFRYLDEQVFRYNRRDLTDLERLQRVLRGNGWETSHLQGTDREDQEERTARAA